MSSSNRWGVRSRDTGYAYLMAYTQDGAEYLQAATGRLDLYEVVQLDSGGTLVVHPTRPGVQLPIPKFALKPVDSRGDDEEIVRLVIVLSDPLYGVEIPSMTVTAAEIRERAEHQMQAEREQRWGYRIKRWLGI